MSGASHRGPILASAILLLSVLAAEQAAALHPHERDGWLLGVSWGLGKGKFRDEQGTEIELLDGVSPQWRFGRFLTPRWLLHFENEAWLLESGDMDVKWRRSLQNYLLAVTWYPGNPDNFWGGLYFRFGVGLGVGGIARIELDEELEQVSEERIDETGTGSVLGVGYEFRLTGQFAAGFWLGASFLDIKRDFVHEAWFAPLTLDFSWHF